MELYREKWHGRCRLTPFPIALPFNASNMSNPIDIYPVSSTYLDAVLAHPDWFRCNRSDGVTPYDLEETWATPTNCFWPVDPDEAIPYLCRPKHESGRHCAADKYCGSNYDRYGNGRFLDIKPQNLSLNREPLFNANLNYGFTHFDNLYHTFVVILQVITASGWVVLTETVR